LDGPAGEDVVQLDVSLLERPCGDPQVNQALWDLADEQVVDPDCKRVLRENGFRVCTVGGLPPAGLQGLLSSPRSCPEPHRVCTHAGSPAPLTLGAPWKRCAFRLRQDGGATDVSFEDAQCLLEVVPALADEGRVTLRFTPHVKHGSASIVPRAERDPGGALRWGMEARQPEESYAWLAWELTVAPDEYVIVGARLDGPDTLAHRCFLPAAGEGPRRQRLLVLRCARAPAGEKSYGRSAPLAVQATRPAARGSSR
jgi:hypothetical protein